MSDQMSALQEMSAQIKQHDVRVKKLEVKSNKFESELQVLAQRMDNFEYSGKSTIVNINGIPERPDENLVSVVNDIGKFVQADMAKMKILAAERFISKRPPKSSSEISPQPSTEISPNGDVNVGQNNTRNEDLNVPIIATFETEEGKNELLNAFRRKGEVFVDDIGFSSSNADVKKRIIIYEHLIPSLKILHTKAKLFQKANKYKYLWTKNGKIFLRKGDTTKVIRVFPHTDFTNLVKDEKIQLKNGNKGNQQKSGGSGGRLDGGKRNGRVFKG